MPLLPHHFSASLSSLQVMKEVLLVVNVRIDGMKCTDLIDTGCSCSLTNISNCRPWKKKQEVDVLTADRKVLKSRGVTSMEVHIDNGDPINKDVLVVESKFLGFNLHLRMDVIEQCSHYKNGSGLLIPYLCRHDYKSAQFYCEIRPVYQDLDSIMEVVGWTPIRIYEKPGT